MRFIRNRRSDGSLKQCVFAVEVLDRTERGGGSIYGLEVSPFKIPHLDSCGWRFISGRFSTNYRKGIIFLQN